MQCGKTTRVLSARSFWKRGFSCRFLPYFVGSSLVSRSPSGSNSLSQRRSLATYRGASRVKAEPASSSKRPGDTGLDNGRLFTTQFVSVHEGGITPLLCVFIVTEKVVKDFPPWISHQENRQLLDLRRIVLAPLEHSVFGTPGEGRLYHHLGSRLSIIETPIPPIPRQQTPSAPAYLLDQPHSPKHISRATCPSASAAPTSPRTPTA